MPRPMFWGLVLSALWAVGVLAFVCWKWAKISGMEPNAFGDMMAGLFAPLAALWLVVAVFLQKDELIAQRKELALQREASQDQAKQAKSAVEIAQAAFNRDSDNLGAQALEQKINGIAQRIRSRYKQISMELDQSARPIFGVQTLPETDVIFSKALEEMTALKAHFSRGTPIKRSLIISEMQWLEDSLQEVIDAAPSYLRVENLVESYKLAELRDIIEDFRRWAEDKFERVGR